VRCKFVADKQNVKPGQILEAEVEARCKRKN